MALYPETDETHVYLATHLAATGIQYLHLVDTPRWAPRPCPNALKAAMRKAWPRTFITCGGFDRAKRSRARGGQGGFRRLRPAFLPTRSGDAPAERPPAQQAGLSTFYTPGPKGYTDYPAHGGR